MTWRGNARLNAKRDGNERPIIDAFESRGFAVWQINGRGVPDLLLSKNGRMWLVEVKQPKGAYNQAQIKFRVEWTGPVIACVRSVDEALAFTEGPAR